MAVFVEMLSDSELLNMIRNYNEVIVLACIGCANPCVAYQKEIACEKIYSNQDNYTGKLKNKIFFPYAIYKEAQRIKNVFLSHGIKTEIILWDCPCILASENVARISGSEFHDSELIRLCINSEAVIILACFEATAGIKKLFGKQIRVVSGMKTIGRAFFYKIKDKTGKFTIIDKEKSIITHQIRANQI